MAILDKIKTKFVNKRFLKLELLMLGILSIIACILYVSDVPPVMAQDGTAALPEVVMPQSGQRVLVFSPHPDDESIGVGGYIAQSIANGANVEIVLVTNGNFHGNVNQNRRSGNLFERPQTGNSSQGAAQHAGSAAERRISGEDGGGGGSPERHG